MAWRSSTTPLDRVFASLVYLIPLYDGIVYGRFLFAQFPFLNYLQYPLIPLAIVYGLIPFGLGSLVVFIALFIGVVRNEKIPHFIRFNAMQAILISILLSLIGLIYSFILQPIVQGFIAEVLFNTIFLGVLATVGYSVVQSVRGRYAEMPLISEASYLQTR
ncbi:hypothetical protein GlitD10_1589 [Gloeomargarita lithophora Alchichica-D10]|uniref:Tic20 family protein n=1 Tax=Gloeomargarita lithophora Alchichica-D10 TaxID=1188229 RepID=A0A1J0ADC0_9CYAN|nr:Tic20 family protein [Gloeomargarita lithophora]APB33913.1 hypothetical protein GlitD10_1589 [Gloeomargarita lithophora Alchichica-D10]